ncbi:hypothetical protein [Methylomagnum sp.]
MKTKLLSLIILGLAACSRPIPQDIHDALDKQFASRLMENGWKFVKVTHGFGGKELVADILVPQAIPGDAGAQHELLKSKVCPATSGNDGFWKKLDGYKLSVAAYTQDRKFTVLVDCQNPYAQERAGQ